MAARELKVVCAWCNSTIAAAPTGTPITHTICAVCLDLALALPDVVVGAQSRFEVVGAPPRAKH